MGWKGYNYIGFSLSVSLSYLRALPLLLDSDEEVMTTKFEMSKMN